MAVYTGLRRTDLLALTWKDVALEERYLSVNKGLHTHSSPEERYQPPKTDKSKRRVPQPNELVLALPHYRETEEAIKDRMRLVLSLDDPIFARPTVR